ncbi:hypothetical protein MNBD_GAMMA07-1868 [hydrothermal vent metagenome]|uniref:Anti sigma-E protein RseA N-terminal domain-containing protein n=1 Tax=hydrothermal vent metagenome TaxID=652676 RepID=A0A3B0X7L6_9ZZZZ
MNNGQQTRDENLSALLDNALSDEQLNIFMQDLKRDPIADAETAQRYSLMGEVMRDELSAASFVDISAAVHRAIEDEPVLNDVVSTTPTNKFSLSDLLASWANPLTGVAVAASVASVTLVSYNAMQTSEQSTPVVQIAQKSPVQPVNIDILRNVQVASTLNLNKPSVERQKVLNKYMLQHSGYASRSTMQGMMPYVRAAGAKSQEIMREKK